MERRLATALPAAICLLKAFVNFRSDSAGGGFRREVGTVGAFFVEISKASMFVLLGALAAGNLSIELSLAWGGLGRIYDPGEKFSDDIILLIAS